MATLISLPWNISTRYLRSRQKSLALVARFSVLGLIVAISVLYLVQMMVTGFQVEMEKRMVSVYPHISLHHDGKTVPRAELEEIVRSNQQVLGWATSVDSFALIAGSDRTQASRVMGIDPLEFHRVSDLEQYTTKSLRDSLTPGEFGVVVGDQIAESLKLRVGDALHIFDPSLRPSLIGLLPKHKRFTVVDIVDTKSILDSQFVYTHQDDLRRLLGVNESGNRILIRVDEPLDVYQHVYELTEQLQLSGFGLFGMSTWSSFMGLHYRFLRVMENVFFLLLSLLVAVASFNLVSTMIMLVHERSGDIAILCTYGGNTYLLTSTFVLSAGLIALVGIIGGLALAWVLGLILEWSFPWIVQSMRLDLVDVVFLKTFEMRFALSDLLKVIGLGCGLAMLASAYPAYRVAKLLPAEVLRDE